MDLKTVKRVNLCHVCFFLTISKKMVPNIGNLHVNQGSIYCGWDERTGLF